MGGNLGGLPQEADKKPKQTKRLKKVAPKKIVTNLKKNGSSWSVLDRLPDYAPHTRCRLRLLKAMHIYDMLQIEKDFISSQDNTESYRQFDEKQKEDLAILRGKSQSIATLQEIIDDEHVLVSKFNGQYTYYTKVLSIVDKDLLVPGCQVFLHNTNSKDIVCGVLKNDEDPMVTVMRVDKAPTETYADIGGLEKQIREIKETVELPLTRPELFEDLGITPPKGVILYGPPGTGKTLLAKAVANSTSASFLRITGSELIQKYSGEGPRLVRELFKSAEEMSPSIIFIDEIDSIGYKRYDASSGGEREVQRTMLELLNQLDGFDTHTNIKVILATNKIESLDTALIRPGRVDRKIEFPYPDDPASRKKIFAIHTGKMNLSDEVDLREFINTKENISGADIKAICTEAGLLALRERRIKVTMDDFKQAKEKVMYRKKTETADLYS